MERRQQVIIRVSPVTHRKLKALLSIQGLNIQGFLSSYISDYVDEHEESSVDHRLKKLIGSAPNGLA